MTERAFDLAIIGGGANGCGIARDAAGRGLSVLLVEQGDLGGATSSASTKLIHGGLRYLEQYEFRLVRASLAEREILLRAAPHIIRPMRFVLPHHAGLRPRWMIRAGLFLYDHLGGRDILPGTQVLDLRRDPAGAALQSGFTHGFEYSDCWVDDARLVLLNARDAANRGADVAVRTRTRCAGARRRDGHWLLDLRGDGGVAEQVAARVLVNAAGPWVSNVLADVAPTAALPPARLVKGSHIIVPRLVAHDRSYIFQNADRRVCFAIPYEDDFTLIGTTETDFRGDPVSVACNPAEESYLCDAVSTYFRAPVRPEHVVWRYAGVRPLHDDGAASVRQTTRDYMLVVDAPGEHNAPPLLSVFGGKITTYRRLGEAVLARLAPFLPGHARPWTAGTALPGGDFPWDGTAALIAELAARFSFLEPPVLHRLVRTYGTCVADVLGDARSPSDLGADFGAGFTAREADYLRRREWAVTAEDMLWRRTKRGLHMDPAGHAAVRAFVGQ